MAQRAVACTTCHGKEGRATNEGYFPRIAGKPAGYLYNQLVNFRDGRRHYALMTYLVEHLTDPFLYEMAEYFAGLDLAYPPPPNSYTPHAFRAAGESLARSKPTTVARDASILPWPVPSLAAGRAARALRLRSTGASGGRRRTGTSSISIGW